jgi:folate-dependent phosphoribosylglycinamide formyltransferase PurN
MAVRLAQLGHAPVGVLTLPALERGTILRKLGQWGARDVIRYAWGKLAPSKPGREVQLRNPCLESFVKNGEHTFRSLHEVARTFGFPVAVCRDQSSDRSVTLLKRWSPDLMIFTGGNILRKQLLEVPRLGVINGHLGLLPEIRGMSSPEWSLLKGVPLGVTLHYIDTGIDTGPVLLRREIPGVAQCESLDKLRNRLVAYGVELIGEVVLGLERGTISAKPQSDLDKDRQYFVMHEWLGARAENRLKASSRAWIAERQHG